MPFSSALSGSSTTTSSQNPKYGMLSVARAKAKKRAQGARDDASGNLPPLEAFTFKSFMANGRVDSDDASHSINADLDRIAEICARSRYSLSNQYEVHKAPHGSGESFLAAVAAAKNQPIQGPTLQVVSSDDERQMRHSRRRRGIRRRSVAVGTLETIMSSSRSSEEDKSKKHKSAAEIAEEVRVGPRPEKGPELHRPRILRDRWLLRSNPGKASHAEGSLRELLKSSSQDKPDAKGKGVERSQ
ncbi:unnamed protein product [Parascedosporium putredinis]|uniref:Uncharacterized protein n=1 Tax=Parascedosporium putredinis TaxID=1442378 RepID=A0A9P1M9Y3_9PEZI|nr:unnamed protein product [Parascedosporium putredinis]CAI7992937.1 unnamed protein product [Parascedosporium putredinis]